MWGENMTFIVNTWIMVMMMMMMKNSIDDSMKDHFHNFFSYNFWLNFFFIFAVEWWRWWWWWEWIIIIIISGIRILKPMEMIEKTFMIMEYVIYGHEFRILFFTWWIKFYIVIMEFLTRWSLYPDTPIECIHQL